MDRRRVYQVVGGIRKGKMNIGDVCMLDKEFKEAFDEELTRIGTKDVKIKCSSTWVSSRASPKGLTQLCECLIVAKKELAK